MEITSTPWTWHEILGLIVGTGLCSAVFSALLNGLVSYYRRRTSAQYSAMRAAVALEKYAVDCWSAFIIGNGDFEHHRSMVPVTLPGAPDLPDDIEWKAIDPALSDDVLSFSNATGVSEALATYAAMFENNPFDFHSVARARGREALKLAGRLRNRYSMRSHEDFNRVWKDFGA